MALVLTRREGESLLIGDNVVVTIAKIKGTQVQVAIDAPKDMQILRDEAVDREAPDE